MKKIVQIANLFIIFWVYYNLIVMMINQSSFDPQWWILFFVTTMFCENVIKSINEN